MAASRWQSSETGFRLQVEIPANTTATVYVPAVDAGAITESDDPLASWPAIRIMGSENGYVVLKIGSGKYRFEVTKN